MLVNEKFPLDEQNNIFVMMNNKKPFLWAELYSPQQMYNYFVLTQGNSFVTSSFENVNNETIANLLSEMFTNRWNTLFKTIYHDDVENILGYNDVTTETETSNNSDDETETENKVNQVSAFDDDDFSNNEKDNNITTRARTGENQRTRKIIHSGHDGEYMKEVKRFYDLFTKQFLYDIIFSDIKNVVVSPIY